MILIQCRLSTLKKKIDEFYCTYEYICIFIQFASTFNIEALECQEQNSLLLKGLVVKVFLLEIIQNSF